MSGTRRWLRVLVSCWLVSQLGAGVLAFGPGSLAGPVEPVCCRHMAPGQVCPMHRHLASRAGHNACRISCEHADRSAVCPVTGPVGLVAAAASVAPPPQRLPLPHVAPSPTIARSRAPATPPPRA